MSYQLTIRIDDDLNEKAIEQADKLGVTRASLIRRALNSYLSKSNPNENSKEIIDLLKQQLEIANHNFKMLMPHEVEQIQLLCN